MNHIHLNKDDNSGEAVFFTYKNEIFSIETNCYGSSSTKLNVKMNPENLEQFKNYIKGL